MHDGNHSSAAVVAAQCECTRATHSFRNTASLFTTGFGSHLSAKRFQALVTETQRDVIGVVRLKLYKGNIIVVGRKSPKNIYDGNIATMETDASTHDQSDANGFVRLNGLQLKLGAAVKDQ